jgi:hypothetical protein
MQEEGLAPKKQFVVSGTPTTIVFDPKHTKKSSTDGPKFKFNISAALAISKSRSVPRSSSSSESSNIGGVTSPPPTVLGSSSGTSSSPKRKGSPVVEMPALLSNGEEQPSKKISVKQEIVELVPKSATESSSSSSRATAQIVTKSEPLSVLPPKSPILSLVSQNNMKRIREYTQSNYNAAYMPQLQANNPEELALIFKCLHMKSNEIKHLSIKLTLETSHIESVSPFDFSDNISKLSKLEYLALSIRVGKFIGMVPQYRIIPEKADIWSFYFQNMKMLKVFDFRASRNVEIRPEILDASKRATSFCPNLVNLNVEINCRDLEMNRAFIDYFNGSKKNYFQSLEYLSVNALPGPILDKIVDFQCEKLQALSIAGIQYPKATACPKLEIVRFSDMPFFDWLEKDNFHYTAFPPLSVLLIDVPNGCGRSMDRLEIKTKAIGLERYTVADTQDEFTQSGIDELKPYCAFIITSELFDPSLKQKIILLKSDQD